MTPSISMEAGGSASPLTYVGSRILLAIVF